MTAVPHLLVIRRRYLGDIVLLGSFLRNLRLHWPDARIGVLTESAYTAVLALNPDTTGAIALPNRLGAWPKFLRTLRRAGFTHVFDLDNTAKTAILSRLTGAPVRHVFHLENVRRHFPGLYTHTTFVGSADYSARHITETYLAMLATFADIDTLTAEVFDVRDPVGDGEHRVLPRDHRIIDAELTLRAAANDELALGYFEVVTEVAKPNHSETE